MAADVNSGICQIKELSSRHGKKQFPHLHNRPSSPYPPLPPPPPLFLPQKSARRSFPQEYGINVEFRPHIHNIQPKYTDCGPDWKSRLRWLPSPRQETSESARYAEIWPESWKSLRTFPNLSGETEKFWVIYPEESDSKLRCTFNGVHKATQRSHQELEFFPTNKPYYDKRNGIPVVSPGDKPYKRSECSPSFFKFGTTLPIVNFGGPNKKKFDTFIPLSETVKSPREYYKEKDLKRKKKEEENEVSALEEWRPATPLVMPTIPSNRNQQRIQNRSPS